MKRSLVVMSIMWCFSLNSMEEPHEWSLFTTPEENKARTCWVCQDHILLSQFIDNNWGEHAHEQCIEDIKACSHSIYALIGNYFNDPIEQKKYLRIVAGLAHGLCEPMNASCYMRTKGKSSLTSLMHTNGILSLTRCVQEEYNELSDTTKKIKLASLMNELHTIHNNAVNRLIENEAAITAKVVEFTHFLSTSLGL